MKATQTLYRRRRSATASLLLMTLLSSMAISIGQQRRPSAQRRPTPGVQQTEGQQQTSRESSLEAANTLKVTPVLSQDVVTQLVKKDIGATLSAQSSNGTRFTLTVPKGVLAEDLTITLTPVAGINDLPFRGGLFAALQIKPEDAQLARPITLVIEPPTSIPAAQQLSFASFAYRGNGQDFHLYPLEIDPSRIAFRLVSFGGYGIARGTEAEQEAVRQRPPADPADRMMMETQKLNRLLRERLLRRGSVRPRPRRDESPFIHAAFEPPSRDQSATQTGPTSSTFNPAAYLANLLNTLRLSYENLVSRFKALEFDCRSNVRIRVREVIDEATRWQKAVSVNGLLEEIEFSDLTPEEKEMVIRSRLSNQGLSGPDLERAVSAMMLSSITGAERDMVHANRLRRQGYTDQEIAAVLGEGKAITEEIKKKQDSLNELCWEALRKGYNKAFQCCMCEPKHFHLDMMIGYMRQMTLISETRVFEVVDPGQLAECENAIVDGTSSAAGWRGSVTIKSVRKDESSGKAGNSIQYRKIEDTYEATLEVKGLRDANGKQIGKLTANATHVLVQNGRGLGQCYRVTEQLTSIRGTATDNSAGLHVYLSPRTGRYSINVSWPEPKGNGTYTITSDVKGTCPNPFNRSFSDTEVKTDVHMNHFLGVQAEGALDPDDSDVLSGTKVENVRVGLNGHAEITITWNLSRCKAD